MPDPEDMSPEAAMRELAEILAVGFMRLRNSEANLADGVSEIEGHMDVTDEITNGCNQRNVSD